MIAIRYLASSWRRRAATTTTVAITPLLFQMKRRRLAFVATTATSAVASTSAWMTIHHPSSIITPLSSLSSWHATTLRRTDFLSRQKQSVFESSKNSLSSSSSSSSSTSVDNDLEGTQQRGDEESQFATTYHAPVMWKECIDALLDCEQGRKRKVQVQKEQEDSKTTKSPPLIFVDGTLGGGGHSAALLQRLVAGDVVFGCDVDPNALSTASERLKEYMNHDGSQRPLFVPVNTNFCDIATVLPKISYTVTSSSQSHAQGRRILLDEHDQVRGVDGILLDLGVSSHQIDEPERGFSFMKEREGPLDMRMSSTGSGGGSGATSSTTNGGGPTAADIVNQFDAGELQRIFSVYGDEPRSKTLASAIIKHRPLSTTGELVDAIASVTPKFAKNKRKGRTATCARIFQSLRIVVNDEDGVLHRVLSQACPSLLQEGGRLVVLSYHSMEDRATKRIMRDGSLDKDRNRRQSQFDERDMYGNYIGPPKPFKPVGKKQRATEEETERNPRARSATLRVAERQ